MKRSKILYAVVMFSLIFTVACNKDGEENKEFTKLVRIEKVTDQPKVDYLIFNGKVKEKSLVTLSFRVGGPLVHINVNAGDYVNKGEEIAQIDKRDYQIQLDNAKAQYEQINGEYERYKELYNKNKVPANTYEKIEAGYKQAKAGYENALNQLNDTELKAPISGYIYEKMVENFNTVGAGQPIVSIIDMSQLEIVISVPENQILDIKQCQKNYLTVRNADVYEVPVTLKSVSEKTGSDGLYEVRFVLNNQDKFNIYPGMTAEVKIVCQDKNSTMQISSNAVFTNHDKTYVWIYDSSKQQIKKQEITIASLQPGGMLRVVNGLKDGDLIVTAGVHSLVDGQKVKPIAKESATNVGGLL